MTWIQTGIILLFLGALSLVSGNRHEKPQWQSYENHDLGVALNYPIDWDFEEFKREQPGTEKISPVKGKPSYYTHVIIGQLPGPHDTSYSYVGDIIEVYSKAELLNPFYYFSEADGSIDDRGTWDEFDRYINDPRDDLYDDFQAVTYTTIGDFRALYRDKGSMIALRQSDCNFKSGKTRAEEVSQCIEIFIHVLNSLRFRANI